MMTGTDVLKGNGKKVVRFTVGLLALLIVAGWSGVGAAQVRNPSFEVIFPGLPRVPNSWPRLGNSSLFEAFSTTKGSTDGDWAAALASRTDSSFSPGRYYSYNQWVDLTGVSRIVFDVELRASGGLFEHFEASLWVNDVLLWSSTTGGIYLDQQVSLAGLPDDWPYLLDHIELRLMALDTRSFGNVSHSALWDNIRCLEDPLWLPAVIDIEPGTLNLASNGRWVTCYIELDEDGAVALIDGDTVTLDGMRAEVQEHGWAARWANEDNITDQDGDGIPERMVRFSREAVQAVVEAPQTTVTIQGYLLDGTAFEGTAVLRVLDKNAKKK